MAAKKRRSVHDVVKRAQKAWSELELSLVTKADKERHWRVWEGLRALDDEQADLKATLEMLFDENADVGAITFEQVQEALAERGISFQKRTVTVPMNSPEADAMFDAMLRRTP